MVNPTEFFEDLVQQAIMEVMAEYASYSTTKVVESAEDLASTFSSFKNPQIIDPKKPSLYDVH